MAHMGFARRLASADRCLVGTWVKIPALEPVEILADAGFDYIVIDQEHAPLTLEFAYQATVVAQGAGMSVLVRVPDRSGSHLQRLLDAGVDGILVPRVTSVAEATSAVRQMLFSPGGDRGIGITWPAAGAACPSRNTCASATRRSCARSSSRSAPRSRRSRRSSTSPASTGSSSAWATCSSPRG